MAKSIASDETFHNRHFNETPLEHGAYEQCHFQGCDFSQVDLTDIQFTDCTFKDCHCSMAVLHNTAIRDARFTGCKMLGLHFEDCNAFLFSANFENCQLNHSSFFQRSIKGATFHQCQLQEVDFTEADASGVVFDGCDLRDATFDRTNLEKADFSTATHFTIDPENNRIKRARFSAAGLEGLLEKYGIVVV
jgi:fluoroquinolone resistance protein